MTNDNAALANGKAMTRQDMQDQALIIRSSLETVMVLIAGGCMDEAYSLIKMCSDKAQALNTALDSTNMQEVAQ